MARRAAKLSGPTSESFGADSWRIHKSPSGRDIQQRAVRTRESVLVAAATVFDKEGFAAATLDQIAAAANVTKGALYFHFPSKAAIATAVVIEHHAAWAAVAKAASEWELNALDTLERMIREVAKSYQTNPIARAGVRLGNEYRQLDLELPPPFVGWVERLSLLLRKGQQDGSVNPTLNTAAAARVIVGSFFGIQEMSARLHDRSDLMRRITEWWAILRPSLATS